MKLVVIKYKNDITFQESLEYLHLKGKYSVYSVGNFIQTTNYLTTFKR